MLFRSQEEVDELDEGEETETEHGQPLRLLYPTASAPANGRVAAIRREQRSLSLSSLPSLIDSLYASIPSALLRRPSDGESDEAATRMRRSASLYVDRHSSSSEDDVRPTTYRQTISYWRSVLRRFRDNLDAVL